MNTKPSYAELENRIKELEQAESDRKMVEDALRASEEKYRDFFENAVEGIFQTTPDGRFISANPALLKILGFNSFHELSTLVGNIRQQHYLNPEDRDTFRKTIESRGSIKGFETRLIKKDGTSIWASLTARAVSDDEGNVLYFEGIVEDITQRKQAEQTMRLVHFGVNHSRDAIFWLDARTRLIYVNDAACRSLGYSREELLTMTVSDIDPDFSRASWEDHLARLREKGAITHESRHRTRDGRTFPVEITGNYVKFEGSEGSFAFARDISSRKQAAAEQEKLQTQLIQAMLESMNYTVVTAGTPNQALALAQTRDIHLMITDVVMPDMNGRDLADRMKELNPETKVVFMSGYTANVIAHHGILDEDIHFIQKPFSMADISRMVRDVLGE